MPKHIYPSILVLFVTLASYAQIPTGAWRMFTPNNDARGIDKLGDKIFVAFENGVFEHDVVSNENNLWTSANLLSDVGVTTILTHSASKTLVIAYENGNIDLLTNNVLYNVPALVLATVPGNKRINKLISRGDFVYVACGLGILKLNPKKKEIADTYYPFPSSTPILDIAFKDDSIFALSENSIRVANINNIALADFSQWQTYAGIPDIGSASFKNLILFNNELWLHAKTPSSSYATDTLYRKTASSFQVVPEFLNFEIHSIQVFNNQLFFSADARFAAYDTNLSQIELIFQYDNGSFIAPNGAIKINDDYYIADKRFGLVKARNSFSHQKIGFQGPFKNSFFELDFKNGVMLAAGGGLNGFNQTFNLSGVYVFKDEQWSFFNNSNATSMGENTWDVIAVSVDPNDSNHYFFGTYSPRGLFEVKDGQTIDSYYTASNSPLELTTLGNNVHCVSELEFDNKSNLWIGQSYANAPLKVLTKEGVFQEFDLGVNPKAKFIFDLAIDYNGYKWLATRGGGLVAFNDNQTILDNSDDQYKVFNNGEGQGNLASSNVTSVCVDFNNDIWVGSDNGLRVIYNSDRVFSSDEPIEAQRILLPFEEEIEGLLGNTSITKIVLDGGNRKWIASESAGVFLFSQDGRTEVYNFNTFNSPLASNNVLDIAINDQTGEVFFVTEKGLQSFRSDASVSDFEYSDVQVFPNPYRPDFTGFVTIQGIAYESEVQITDIAGNLVFKTVSNGGTATWNGQTLAGERAASGIYQIWTAPRNAKGRYVGKFVLVN